MDEVGRWQQGVVSRNLQAGTWVSWLNDDAKDEQWIRYDRRVWLQKNKADIMFNTDNPHIDYEQSDGETFAWPVADAGVRYSVDL